MLGAPNFVKQTLKDMTCQIGPDRILAEDFNPPIIFKINWVLTDIYRIPSK